MKFEWNRKGNTIAAYAFFVLALAIGFFHLVANFHAVNAWLLALVRPIFPIFYGFAIAYLLDPIMTWIEGRFDRIAWMKRLGRRRRRTLSMLLTYLFTALVINTFAVIVLPQVGLSLASMVAQIQSYVATAERVVETALASIPEGLVPQSYINQVSDMAGKTVSDLISLVGSSLPMVLNFAVNLGSLLINAVMGIIVSIYLLFSKEKFLAQLRKAMWAFLPKQTLQRVARLTHTTDLMFGKFITGKIIDSIIIGVLCFLGLSALKMPNTVLVSFLVGITNIIPYFGPFLGAIPSFFLIAFISPAQGILFLLFVLVLQQLDGNVIGPMILGDSTGLSAFWVVFAILFFGGAFGIFGMFIGVPTFGVIYWMIREKIIAQLGDKGLATETDAYMEPLFEKAKQEEPIDRKE
ncbi:MAG: AI-2E family transporter [Oscillospiraceae bacterium]